MNKNKVLIIIILLIGSSVAFHRNIFSEELNRNYSIIPLIIISAVYLSFFSYFKKIKERIAIFFLLCSYIFSSVFGFIQLNNTYIIGICIALVILSSCLFFISIKEEQDI